jgi:hypothetical protein
MDAEGRSVFARTVTDAFPSSLKAEASIVAMRLTSGATCSASPNGFVVVVAGETIAVPERLYFEEVTLRSNYSATGLAILDCLQTRHHNGFVRERALRQVLARNTPWSIPFVVRLISEYVIEILDLIDTRWAEIDGPVLGEFLVANPGFHSLVRRRVISYWDCYYRGAYPRWDNYLGFRLLNRMDKAVEVASRK